MSILKVLFILLFSSVTWSQTCNNTILANEKAWKANYSKKDILMEYNERRDLSDYLKMMPTQFTGSLLRALKNGGHILDAGSGQGRFSMELARAPELPMNQLSDPELTRTVKKIRKLARQSEHRVTAVTASSFAGLPSGFVAENQFEGTVDQNLRLFAGRLFEEIPNRDLTKYGAVDLIVDLWGVMAYSHDPKSVLMKYHEVLNEGGEVYIRVDGYIHSTMMRDEVLVGNKIVNFVTDWLPKIEGFDYEFIRFADGATVRLTKNSAPFSVPNLVLVEKDNNLPPIRKFKQVRTLK